MLVIVLWMPWIFFIDGNICLSNPLLGNPVVAKFFLSLIAAKGNMRDILTHYQQIQDEGAKPKKRKKKKEWHLWIKRQ